MATKNINVEIDEDTWIELRKRALDNKQEFHEYIRQILECEVK
jgi:hypothetical protein